MKLKLTIIAAALVISAAPLKAQFSTSGSAPASMKWSYVQTQRYRVIYPQGLDSLARVYARTLEQVAAPVGDGIGFEPNCAYRNRMPVVLQPYAALANGMVTWTPRRMELYTSPDASPTEASPWNVQLGVHESRHVAQMQYSNMRPFRLLNILSGQLGAGAAMALYCGPSFFEGDAVRAETALGKSGRGRTAYFLEYFRAAAADSLTRDWYSWRYGSQKQFTPDYYKIGYITMGGIPATFNAPDMTRRYYERIAEKHGFAFFNMQKTVKEVTGMKFRDAFRATMDGMASEWAEDDARRAPFTPSEEVTPAARRYSEFNKLEFASDTLFAVRHSLSRPRELVSIGPDGKARRIRNFNPYADRLQYADGRLWWSEYRQNARWEMKGSYQIRYMDGKGHVHSFSRGGNFHSPVPFEDKVAAVEMMPDGSSRIVVLGMVDGFVKKEYKAPDGLQPLELAWCSGELYASASGADGSGLYRVEGWEPVLGQSPVMLNQLQSRDGKILFASDRSGVSELYSLNPQDGSLMQLTTLRQGGNDFRYNAAGDSLYFTSLSTRGRLVHRAAVSNLQPKKVEWDDRHEWTMADRLSSFEKQKPDFDAEVQISEPQKYSRGAHLLRFHSWLPLYYDFDDVSNISFETIFYEAGLGATAFFQNDLGNAYGSISYHAGLAGNSWTHSGHAKFTYSGWYPVIESRLDVGDRKAIGYYIDKNQLKGKYSSTPLVSGSLTGYIPFRFSHSGLSIGFIPRVRLNFTNDSYQDRSMSRLSSSVRGYVIEGTPSSRIYPRLGIGAEIGHSCRPFAYINSQALFTGNAYAYIYGYVPGIGDTHGIKLTALGQASVGDGLFMESYANVAPRGMGSEGVRYMTPYPQAAKFTFDYAMPVAPVDWSWLSPLAYIRNFELILHGDLSTFWGKGKPGTLTSVGADVIAHLGNFLWIPYDTRIGVSIDVNGGSSFDSFNSSSPVGRVSVGAVFSVDF